jgi:hypothetical protein
MSIVLPELPGILKSLDEHEEKFQGESIVLVRGDKETSEELDLIEGTLGVVFSVVNREKQASADLSAIQMLGARLQQCCGLPEADVAGLLSGVVLDSTRRCGDSLSSGVLRPRTEDGREMEDLLHQREAVAFRSGQDTPGIRQEQWFQGSEEGQALPRPL